MIIQMDYLLYIQHHIGLIRIDNLPNLQHYRMSLKENEIIQGHVKDLIKKVLKTWSILSSNNINIFTSLSWMVHL